MPSHAVRGTGLAGVVTVDADPLVWPAIGTTATDATHAEQTTIARAKDFATDGSSPCFVRPAGTWRKYYSSSRIATEEKSRSSGAASVRWASFANLDKPNELSLASALLVTGVGVKGAMLRWAGLVVLIVLFVTLAPSAPQGLQRAAGIAGVVAPDAVVELVQEGFAFTEGPVGRSDGGIYFTDSRPSRIYRLDPNGKISIFRENADNSDGSLSIRRAISFPRSVLASPALREPTPVER